MAAPDCAEDDYRCDWRWSAVLWKDESIVPVRGQIAWLIPQRDGIVVQSIGGGDRYGYNDANEAPDRAAAKAAVGVLAGLYGRMKS